MSMFELRPLTMPDRADLAQVSLIGEEAP
jgi:hypothetical protein